MTKVAGDKTMDIVPDPVVFKALQFIDTNHDGVFSFAEVNTAATRTHDMRRNTTTKHIFKHANVGVEGEVFKLLQKWDQNGDGTFSFAEINRAVQEGVALEATDCTACAWTCDANEFCVKYGCT